MFANATSLVQFLRTNEFVNSAQADDIVRDIQPRNADVRSLVQELVRRGFLTTFQANELVLGRGQDLVVGPYRLLERLGEGGMGQVLKARHSRMDRIVALKFIQQDRLSQPGAVQRFFREARAAAQLSHPNIVAAHDAGEAGQVHFLAMEYVEGVDLARLVQQSGRLAIPLACDFIMQAALGLQHAFEKGIVHRDIKPGNLLVTKTGANGAAVVKILDFGLARFDSDASRATVLTQIGNVIGTVDYISPEQAENARKADIRSDIYSLGCSLFYLLTGTVPFPGDSAVERLSARLLGKPDSIRALRPEVPESLDQVLVKMLARDPAQRYQTPAEVAAALQPFVQPGGLLTQSPAAPSAIPNDIGAGKPSPADKKIGPAAAKKRAGSVARATEDKTSPLGPRLIKARTDLRRANRFKLGLMIAMPAVLVAVLLWWLIARSGSDKAGSTPIVQTPTPVVQTPAPPDSPPSTKPPEKKSPEKKQTDNVRLDNSSANGEDGP